MPLSYAGPKPFLLLCRWRTEAEATQKLKRRKKRKREKLGKDTDVDGVIDDPAPLEEVTAAADELGAFQVCTLLLALILSRICSLWAALS